MYKFKAVVNANRLRMAYHTCKEAFVPMLLVHGGVGNSADDSLVSKISGVKQAACIGYETLIKTGDILDAVQEAVCFMELDPLLNAGYGSVLTCDGTIEMDAAIMHGGDLSAGCVSVVRDIDHPIVLARRIMEKTPYRYLAGEGAMNFAVSEGFEILPPGALFTQRALKDFEDFKKRNLLSDKPKIGITGPAGTVGAVAIDEDGNLAAATSTGGIIGKFKGRIGDSPILGAGTYADNNSGAISATGHGETIMRYNVASRILALIEHRDFTAQEATESVLENMTQLFNETAGVIAIDTNGDIGIYFTSKQMLWAYQRGNELHFGVDKDEDEVEIVHKLTI